jgi:hypothetical protein
MMPPESVTIMVPAFQRRTTSPMQRSWHAIRSPFTDEPFIWPDVTAHLRVRIEWHLRLSDQRSQRDRTIGTHAVPIHADRLGDLLRARARDLDILELGPPRSAASNPATECDNSTLITLLKMEFQVRFTVSADVRRSSSSIASVISFNVGTL